MNNINNHEGSFASANTSNVNDVIGGRKTQPIAIAAGVSLESRTEGAVLVSVKSDDAIVFSDEAESVPSLELESDDEETEDEESVWSDGDEEEDEEGELLLSVFDGTCVPRPNSQVSSFTNTDAELEEGLAERLRILADARALKNLAVAFLHPEQPVLTTDGASKGRNFFNRPSAPEQLEDEEADEVADIMEDMAKLKKAARAYMHPEDKVVTEDATLFGRNYYGRASAPEMEDASDALEAARILADARALKQSAVDYMHPEVGVKTTDGACFARCYFNRFSAPETEEDEFADERAEILADALALKKAAVDYLHPEIGVTCVDPTLFGRNYYGRASAPEMEDASDALEAARILADARALKQSAVDYMHPEVGVKTTDGACFARCYFNRFSAPETEEDEFADERAEILADALALKKAAVDYLHPEIGVTCVDPTLFGRNYFNRYSAFSEAPKKEVTPEQVASGDLASLAAKVKGANLPSTKSAKLSSADNVVWGAAKKSASSVNLFGLSEEVM
eukprot:g3514.t1.1.5e174189 g3514  g3514.t1 contig12:2226681-2228540(+)